jgi:hypothetical protein
MEEIRSLKMKLRQAEKQASTATQASHDLRMKDMNEKEQVLVAPGQEVSLHTANMMGANAISAEELKALH